MLLEKIKLENNFKEKWKNNGWYGSTMRLLGFIPEITQEELQIVAVSDDVVVAIEINNIKKKYKLTESGWEVLKGKLIVYGEDIFGFHDIKGYRIDEVTE
jgi:hypothetical protein